MTDEQIPLTDSQIHLIWESLHEHAENDEHDPELYLDAAEAISALQARLDGAARHAGDLQREVERLDRIVMAR